MADSRIEVVLLGTGAPLPNPDRCGAGNVIIAGESRVLVDCGWGSARRLFAGGILPATIDVACFTHMHSDHITDMADFIIMRWTGGAKRPLTVYGPEGTRETMDGFMAALAHDIRYRKAHHGALLSDDGIRTIVHEVEATPGPAPVATVGELTIESFEVDHYPVVPALGLRFRRGATSVVLSGDTKRCDSLVRASSGADLLVCEAMNIGMMRGAIERLRAVNPTTAGLLQDATEYHTHTEDVAAMARDAGVKRLVLSHLIPAVPPTAEDAKAAFTAGMSDIFDGPIEIGHDLMRITVGHEEA